MHAIIALFLILACVLLLGGFNALEGPAAVAVAVIASVVAIVAVVGGPFLRPRSGPQ